MKADIVFWFLIAVLLIWTTSWFVLLDLLFRSLSRRHPEYFRRLGEPGAFGTPNPFTNRALMQFLYRAEYRKLNDATVTMLCHALIMVFAGYLVVFTGFLALLVSLLFTGGP